MEPYISKGEQFWNEDHTEGYEALEEIIPGTIPCSNQFKALGAAPEPKGGHPVVEWFEQIGFKRGGVEAYRSKAKEHNNIKGS